MTLPAFSALPSTERTTSYSVSERLPALTLIWMLIAGCCCCGAKEPGAFGFSNDRSLVYCASTFSCGGGAASGGVPLPLVIRISPGAIWRAVPLGTTGFALREAKSLVRASGYHRPASFHKDDHNSGSRKRPDSFNYAGPATRSLPKQLNMRDFRRL